MTSRTTRARSRDPETSQQAAERLTVDKLNATQARVLAQFRMYGDLPDTKMIEYLNDMELSAGFVKLTSPSGARSRRSELAKPNMDRLEALRQELRDEAGFLLGPNEIDAQARQRLRIEGFRSPLWDTGVRVVVNGSSMIVWGLAR